MTTRQQIIPVAIGLLLIAIAVAVLFLTIPDDEPDTQSSPIHHMTPAVPHH